MGLNLQLTERENMGRTREEIDAEYTSHATKAGDNEYKIKYLHAELDLIYIKMAKCSKEATEVAIEEAKTKKETAPSTEGSEGQTLQ